MRRAATATEGDALKRQSRRPPSSFEAANSRRKRRSQVTFAAARPLGRRQFAGGNARHFIWVASQNRPQSVTASSPYRSRFAKDLGDNWGVGSGSRCSRMWRIAARSAKTRPGSADSCQTEKRTGPEYEPRSRTVRRAHDSLAVAFLRCRQYFWLAMRLKRGMGGALVRPSADHACSISMAGRLDPEADGRRRGAFPREY